MDQQDQRLELIRTVHKIFDRIVFAVKVTPFIYSSIFVVVFYVYNLASERVLDVIDTLFYVSPFVVIVFCVYSKILKLCIWHRITCIIPVIPQAIDWMDSFLHFTQDEVYEANIIAIILIVLLLISAQRVFDYGRNRCPH